MANMQISFPDAVAPRIIEALAARAGWTPQVQTDTGQTQGQAAKGVVVDFMQTVTKHYEAERDAKTARDAALSKAATDIILS